MVRPDTVRDLTPDTTLQRIVVVVTAGSGKTTTARALAQRLGVPHIELDALFWEPNWTPASLAVSRARVAVANSGEAWVIDGNYRAVQDLILARAATVVWLDYSLRTVLWQLWWRTLRRVVAQEELWNGNRERFWAQFMSRDSLLVWAVQTHRRRQTTYQALTGQPEHAHLRMLHFRSPGETGAWLDTVAAAAALTD